MPVRRLSAQKKSTAHPKGFARPDLLLQDVEQRPDSVSPPGHHGGIPFGHGTPTLATAK